MQQASRKILFLFLLLVTSLATGCGSNDPYFPVSVSMNLNSPNLAPDERGVQQVIDVDLVSGCTLFSRLALQDETPGVWPVETTRIVGTTGFVTFRSLYSCAEIGPSNPDIPYSFWKLQRELTTTNAGFMPTPLSTPPATDTAPGSLIVTGSDVPRAMDDPLLTGASNADVEIIFTQDSAPPTNPDDAMLRPNFIYNGVRLNPGLPIFNNPDTVRAVSRCLVIDKIIVRPHAPGIDCP